MKTVQLESHEIEKLVALLIDENENIMSGQTFYGKPEDNDYEYNLNSNLIEKLSE